MSDLDILKKLEGKECKIHMMYNNIYILSGSVNLHLKSKVCIDVKVSKTLREHLYNTPGKELIASGRIADYCARPLTQAIQEKKYKCLKVKESYSWINNGFVFETLYGDLTMQVKHPNEIEVKEK